MHAIQTNYLYAAWQIADTMKKQVVTSRAGAPGGGTLVSLPERPSKYRDYPYDKIRRAIEAVEEKKMSIRRAAEEYGVPKSTLSNHLKGKYAECTKSARRLLSDEEEERLAAFLIGCGTVGYAKSRKEVLAIVQQILFSRGSDQQVTKGWWDSFKSRQPQLTLRNSEALSYARAAANDPTTIAQYFDLLEHTMEVHGLTHRASQIFNCDETGLPLSHKPPKVVAAVGQKHPYAITGNDKAQITVLACGSASGYCIPPMVVFDRKTLRQDMTVGEVPGTFYGLSENGWMDTELFQEWFKNHFLVHAPPMRPLLLLLDGHSSHYQPELLRIAAAESVVLFCLPPHTTHILQPLDNGVFGSLKRCWSEECHRYCSRNPGRVVNRYNFSEIFHSTWMKSMRMENVVSSFRKVGVFPPNREVVLSQITDTTPTSEPRQQLFVPFATPSTTPRHPAYTGAPSHLVPLDTLEQLPTPVLPRHHLQIVQYSPESTDRQLQAQHTRVLMPGPSQEPPLHFTSAEVRKYRKRREEGYYVPDRRYEQWLCAQETEWPVQVEDPVLVEVPQSNIRATLTVPSRDSSRCGKKVDHPSTLEKILHIPTPPARKTKTYTKGARVLTSEDCMMEMKEKELKRLQKEAERLERAEKRKKKAEERLQQQEEKHRRRKEMEQQREQKQKQKAEERQKKKEELEKKRAQKEQISNQNVAASKQSPPTGTECERKKCSHKSAHTWLQCSKCNGWHHCICAGVSHSRAKSMRFVCAACKQ